jgi:hypothetical protein
VCRIPTTCEHHEEISSEDDGNADKERLKGFSFGVLATDSEPVFFVALSSHHLRAHIHHMIIKTKSNTLVRLFDNHRTIKRHYRAWIYDNLLPNEKNYNFVDEDEGTERQFPSTLVPPRNGPSFRIRLVFAARNLPAQPVRGGDEIVILYSRKSFLEFNTEIRLEEENPRNTQLTCNDKGQAWKIPFMSFDGVSEEVSSQCDWLPGCLSLSSSSSLLLIPHLAMPVTSPTDSAAFCLLTVPIPPFRSPLSYLYLLHV